MMGPQFSYINTEAMKFAIKFEETIAKTLSIIQVTDEELASLLDVIKANGQWFGYIESAEYAYDLASQGLLFDQIIEKLERRLP